MKESAFEVGELVKHLNDDDFGIIVSKENDFAGVFLYSILWGDNMLVRYYQSEIRRYDNMLYV